MKLPETKPHSDWKLERSRLLHRACVALESAIAAGGKISHSLRRVARRFNGRAFAADPARTLQLSPLTFRRQWNAWRRGGRLPSAICFKYRPGRVAIVPSPVLVRFAEFCASNRLRSMRNAWHKFCARGASFGRGRRAAEVKISYRIMAQYFPASQFYQLQAHLKTLHVEQEQLTLLKFTVIAGLRSRLPAKMPPRQVKRGPNFEI